MITGKSSATNTNANATRNTSTQLGMVLRARSDTLSHTKDSARRNEKGKEPAKQESNNGVLVHFN
jgi:hypothetical protein